ncbi:mannose-6-phosphate isomerase, class I [Lewinella sp. 4G2]|uniref:mannose-6-phosphate isomerase, class I n=1 Tax=Lewinella sp. 4G2 TaxID=1803372 RepID=UPI0007B4DECA|nr:mannose-6-phosphate isomerase, class I [Lewinella sp. 4G2]OAV44807.1 mannose-6-phosphate isomerase, class I [Lewinella sp. 4G2]
MAVFPITGTVQHYAWGGEEFIPKFLQQEGAISQPWAEYWLGTHAKGPATLPSGKNLATVISMSPADLLGQQVASQFANQLPYLFKILDVAEMLSIQVHPDKEGAEEGFAAEEAAGEIPRDAPNRNYRDDNHKPELGVAISHFYLLHGFCSEAAILKTLNTIPGWDALAGELQQGGIEQLYRHVMAADQVQINNWLQPLFGTLQEEAPGDLSSPNYWAAEAFRTYTKNGNHDRGIFSIYWMNIVHLKPGEGIFQDAGIPHAYLRGTCLELMANSDNVLRGGLTPKHIDVPELLKHTLTHPVEPAILLPESGGDDWSVYPTPAPDFALALSQVHAGGQVTVDATQGPCMLLLMTGEAQELNGSFTLDEHHRTLFVGAGEKITLRALRESVIYRAGVNL